MTPTTPRPIIVRNERSSGTIIAVAIVIVTALIAIAYMALNQEVSTTNTTIIEKPAATAMPMAPAAPAAAPNITIHNEIPPQDVTNQNPAPAKDITINNHVPPKEVVIQEVPAH